MKVRAYVLIVSVALFGMSAGSKKATLTEGSNPGDLAPSIEFLEKDGKAIRGQNQTGRYTLVHFLGCLRCGVTDAQRAFSQ